MKPLIGISADRSTTGKHVLHQVHEKYLDALTAGAGAIGVILPTLIDRPGGAFREIADFDQLLDRLDGLFLTGAPSNVNPARYGATLATPDLPTDHARDHVTLRLIEGARARRMPLLGVCRGFQEINVAMGGTLHQQVQRVAGLADHREDSAASLGQQYAPAHPVAFAEHGALASFTGMTGTEVNSLHGQGIDRLAPGLCADATAPDGLIEAFSGRDHEHFLIGVQWHPEWHFRDNAVSIALLRAFGNAARAYAKQSSAASR